ncbi:hypothetical protein SDJN02_21909, partial [Cucurbita argyrosperma subsp. argyrosperma]
MSKHVTSKECFKKILGWSYVNYCPCDQQASPTKARIRDTMRHETYSQLLRVFRCVCYVFVSDHLHRKFDKKAVKCIFVGYVNQRKGWKCCDPTNGKHYTSRDVVFDEASSWWSSEKKVLPNSNNIKEILQQKMGEQTTHTQPNIGAFEDPSDIDVDEREMDVKNVFLHGELDKEIYINQPNGFESVANPNHVCKLRKALYRLKQARELGMMKELGELKHFLGLEVDHTNERLFLCQQKYTRDMLQKFSMLECKHASTPMRTSAEGDTLFISLIVKLNQTNGMSVPTSNLPSSDDFTTSIFNAHLLSDDSFFFLFFFLLFSEVSNSELNLHRLPFMLKPFSD